MRRTARPWPVSVAVEGLNLGRFLHRVGEADIALTKLRRRSAKKITALVREDALPQLHQIALEGGWQLHIGERKGAGRAAEWMRRRWLLVGAGIIAGISLLLCSQVMWRVEIVDAGTYQAEISSALQALGVDPPMLRSLVNVDEVQQALEWRYPRIAWIECGWRGTTLVIRPIEGVLPRTDPSSDEVCDVVAARDAIVHSVVTKTGTAVVRPGDFVHQGDVLIKGEERTSNGEVKAVSAAGSVTGRVWLGAAVEMTAVIQETEYTGNVQTVWTVSTPWFNLWRMEDCTYDTYDVAVSEQAVGGMFIPMKLHEETRMEVVVRTKKQDAAQLCADAERAARRKLQEKLSPEESLIDIWGNCSMINDEKVQAQAIGEMLVEIGVQQVSSGMAAPAGE